MYFLEPLFVIWFCAKKQFYPIKTSNKFHHEKIAKLVICRLLDLERVKVSSWIP